MKIIKYALLLSGLFFTHFALADLLPSYDPNDRKPAVKKAEKCASAAPPQGGTSRTYACATTQVDAVGAAADVYADELQTLCAASAGRLSCTVTVAGLIGTPASAASFNQSYTYTCQTGWPLKDDVCTKTNPGYRTQNFTIKDLATVYQCPPTKEDLSDPANEDLAKYTIGPIVTDGVSYCHKPNEPLDCDALQGMQPSLADDSFITGDAYSSANPPSCITKCAKDANNVQRCGDCKVVSKSWGKTALGNGLTKWWANAGTFTGAACGDKESEVPPPEAPKCWETKNGLSMCIQDPAEKCVTVNGVQQCEAGCGYINQEFYCKDPDKIPTPDPNDDDKPLPPVDDEISEPNKPLQDMVKSDFKDVQKGVESRVGQVVTGVGNLENSVDALGSKLDEINEQLEYSNGTEEAANNLLKGIKDGVEDISSGMGEGDEDGDGQGGDGDCDPLKGENCAEDGGVVSWWNSPYEDGFAGMVQENMEEFTQSDVYQSLTTDIPVSGGSAPNLQMCMNFGFADFGCHSLDLPAWIWNFIKVAFLFYAAILARRMLIGA